MATGDTSFNTGNAQKTKRNFDPAPAGDYEARLLKNVEIKIAAPRKNDKTNVMSKPKPRVGIRLELLETGENGGKNKLLFHDLSTDMTPDKGGILQPTLADQLMGLADALGDEADIPLTAWAPPYGGPSVRILSPKALKKWLEDRADRTVKLRIKVQAGTKDYPESKNKIVEFFDADGETHEVQAEEELPAGEEVADGEGSEELDDLSGLGEESIEEAQEEEAPAPKPAAHKPAPAPAKKPAPKPVQKKR